MSMPKSLRLAVAGILVLGCLARAQTYSIADYFPLLPNSHWTLVDVTNPSPGDDDGFVWTVLGTGPQSVPPHTVWKIHTNCNEDTDAREDDIDFWNLYDGGAKLGLYGLHKGSAINSIAPNQDIVLTAPLKMGEANMPVSWTGTSTASGSVLTTTILGRVTVTFDSTVTLDQHLDSLDTPLGTFADVIVLLVNVKATITIPFVGSYQVDFMNSTFWLARDVGLVRQNQSVDPDDAQYQALQEGQISGQAIAPTGGVTYTVNYLAGANGHIEGDTPQTVAAGGSTTEVTAVADAGYHFVDWNDGRTDNPRHDTEVNGEITVAANFAIDEPVGSVIGGRLTLDGVGLAGITVVLAGVGTAVSDGNGFYAFDAVADGPYQVIPVGGMSYAFTPPLRLVTVPPSVGDADFTAQATGAGVLIPGPTPIYLAGRDDVTIPPVGANPAEVGFPLGRDCVGDCPAAVQEQFPIQQTAGPGDTFTFTATGGIDYYGGTAGAAGPDGYPATISAIEPLGGISAYNGPHGSLVGVFLGAGNPGSDVPPAALDFTSKGLGTSFLFLSPLIGQVFFIGDGHPGAKVSQAFTAPAGTTRLFLGIADGFSFAGAPGAYDDDIGAFVATVSRVPAVVNHTVTYLAGANGHIDGTTPQTVAHGGSTAEVTAVADGGYHFVGWSDGRNDNPRQDTNVTANITVIATFAADGFTHTVTYLAGANGHIEGDTPQTVVDGGSTTEVTAVADAGYHVVDWSDGRNDNPRQDTNVTADITVTATFAADQPGGSTIGGRVTLGATGLSGLTVVLAGVGTATTDGDGRYAFAGVPDGSYQVIPVGGTSYAFTPPLRLVAVPPSVTNADFAAQATGGAVLVPGPTAIYLAGRTDVTIPPIGVDPAAVGFPLTRVCVGGCPGAVQEQFPVLQAAAAGDTFTFAATGAVDYYGGTTIAAGPDGYADTTSAIDALGGISAYNGPNGSLVGVFLTNANPGPATPPAPLDFGDTGLGTAFPTLFPALGQVFFVGDGQPDTKAPQTFIAPAGATRLFLGIADAFAFGGAPGAYDDDIGTFLVTVNRVPAVVTHTVTYLAGANGHISGTSPQTLAHGGTTAQVTATPDTGYHFVNWSDGRTDNPRQDTNVTADITVTATFAVDSVTHTVRFLAGAGGQIVGATPQTVAHGGATSAVTATASYQFVFVRWDDGDTAATRTVSNVTSDLVFTAQFRAANPVPANGPFLAMVDAGGVALGHGWWNLSGAYATAANGDPLVLNLVHDTKGKLTGTATYTTAKDTVLQVPIKGTAKGKAGAVLVKMTLKGANAAKTVAVALTLNLTVDAATSRLVGTLSGSVMEGGVVTPVNTNLALAIPAPMDGTWTLRFVLASSGTAVTGTARLTLANGAVYDYLVKGKTAGQTAALSLSAAPNSPAAKAIKIKTTIIPLEGGWAHLDILSGKGYGQALAWD